MNHSEHTKTFKNYQEKTKSPKGHKFYLKQASVGYR